MTAPPPVLSLPPRWPRRVGFALLAAIAVLLGIRFGAVAQDDAFISFRYADNLLRGLGFVYNPGEAVEGYSNLLWTLLVAAAMACGADPVMATVVMGLSSLVAGVFLTGALTSAGRRRWISSPLWLALLPPALLALDATVALEAVEGLETVFYMALVTAATWLSLEERWVSAGDGWGGHRGSAVLFGVATLTRPEAPYLFALVQGGLLIDAALRGDLRRRWRPSVGAGAVVAVWVVALTAWRLWVYGDPLPNTFYAKTGGLAIGRGLAYLGAHMATHPLLWLLLVLRPLLGRPSRRTLPLASLVLGVLAYILAVGGDFKPTGRFILPILPAMAALGAESAALLALGERRLQRLVPLGLLLLLSPYLLVLQQADRWGAERHANLEARRTVGRFLSENLPPDTVLAIHSAGVIPYYARLTTIDMWGLTNRTIARAPALRFGEGLAGHEKSDPAYVFSLEPDLYLPEDRVFTRQPWNLEELPREAGFPADFTERYKAVNVPVDGRWLNMWVKRGFLKQVAGRP